MKFVEPIKSVEAIARIKSNLGRTSVRDYLLFVFGINTPICLFSLLQLRITDVTSQTGEPLNEVVAMTRRTGEPQPVPLNENVREAIRTYMEANPEAPRKQYLFKSTQREDAIHRVQVRRLVRKWCTDAGLTGRFGASSLRKTWMYWAWQYTKDLGLVQSIVGHSNPMTTLQILGVDSAEARRALWGPRNALDLSRLSPLAATAINLVVQIDRARLTGEPAIKPLGNQVYSPYREAMILIYRLHMQSVDWQMARKLAEAAKGTACVVCGRDYEVMHHTRYDNWAAGELESDDLIPLCETHHCEAHTQDVSVPFWATRAASSVYEGERSWARVTRDLAL